jgi:hypothetical protein
MFQEVVSTQFPRTSDGVPARESRLYGRLETGSIQRGDNDAQMIDDAIIAMKT